MEFSVQVDQDDLARAANPVHNFHLCPRGCGLNLPVDIITLFFFFFEHIPHAKRRARHFAYVMSFTLQHNL